MKHIISKNMIAPCGMVCSICAAYLREKNPCHGCREAEKNMPKTRVNCKMRTCRKRKGRFCYDCPDFPCERLKHLDERYRLKYHMSEIENLKFIKKHGLEKFLKSQEKKWRCPKCNGTISCHNGLCFKCDSEKLKIKKKKYQC